MSMTGHDPPAGTAENYRRFASLEARGRSPRYEALAAAVAGDEPILAFLASLPPAKRQPNLLFAAARYLRGAAPDIGLLRMLVAERSSGLAQVMRARRTQTNEPADGAPFVLVRDGTVPTAFTDPHGTWAQWLA
jgi:Uncharacterized protein conserved in bacteria (DUF2332)